MAQLVSLPEAPPLTRWNKWKRSLNKKLGKPATEDVGTLAEMLVCLGDAVGGALNISLDRVAVTYPPIPGLATYDLSDALEYAGLRPWIAPNGELPRPEVEWPFSSSGLYIEKLSEAHAVMAAHGLGLCENYKNLFDCQEEEEFLPLEKVMVVGLTKVDLRAEVIMARAPLDYFSNKVLDRFVDLDAGLGACGNFDSDRAYWDHVADRLKNLLGKQPTKDPLTQVMLVGENSTHPIFLAALWDAMEHSGYGDDSMLVVKGGGDDMISPLFASARGAAQYARWRQEAPIGCQEWIDCQDGQRREEDNRRVELR
ncbi:hypothetical protein IL306_004035 [Fusarium sp. DS 682]|nr:hypothetical protein IL306_004035 [Fusarium sp. DS 682]